MTTNIAAPLPQVTLREGTVISVDAGAGGPTITKLVLHAFQVIPDATTTGQPILRPRAG